MTTESGRTRIVTNHAVEVTKPPDGAGLLANERDRVLQDKGILDDERADHDQLHDYWTKGEGLKKWAASPHPWTSLYNHLKRGKGLSNEQAKRIAADWFHDVFGYWPGSDKNRVAHGKPPRGSKVGPG